MLPLFIPLANFGSVKDGGGGFSAPAVRNLDPMKKFSGSFLSCVTVLLVVLMTKALTDEKAYDANPPFKLDTLIPGKMSTDASDQETIFYHPKNPCGIFIDDELGMHCVGFDIPETASQEARRYSQSIHLPSD